MGWLIILCSKPQLIDAALLRPGRFDRLVFCDFPRWDERLEILKVHSKTVSLLFETCGRCFCHVFSCLISPDFPDALSLYVASLEQC